MVIYKKCIIGSDPTIGKKNLNLFLVNRDYKLKLGIPHVVILGAGASRAAFPDGDRRGLKLPLMIDFVDTVGLADILKREFISYKGRNFEDLYDELYQTYKGTTFIDEINSEIYSYFKHLRLPDKLTIYDMLVLSLREKDIIASFNWDPLLVQAYQRNSHIAKLPKMVFLHGNVAIGACLNDKIKGFVGVKCLLCAEYLKPTKLLYPIKQKNYTDDPFIKNEWDELEFFLEEAYYLTIFGYSAPKNDIDAISMIKKIYSKNRRRDIAQIEIVDIRNQDELKNNWDDLIVREHYGTKNDIYYSAIYSHPRRSCEKLFMATMQLQPWKDNYPPDYSSLEELQDWIKPLVIEEAGIEKDEKPEFSGLPCLELRKKYKL